VLGPVKKVYSIPSRAQKNMVTVLATNSENPLFPLVNTTTDINIDMIGRRDVISIQTPVIKLFYMGADRLSTDFQINILLFAAMSNTHKEFDFYNDPHGPTTFLYERSDHYTAMAFICFHFNGVHADYQQEKQMLH
jgi:hypothetical protein